MAQGPNHPSPTISTHVLDTELGLPAVGVHVTLYRILDDGRAIRMTQALTDADGRVRDLLERPLAAGDYRLQFSLGQGHVLRATEPRPARERPDAQLSRAAAEEWVRPDDVPRQLTDRIAVTR